MKSGGVYIHIPFCRNKCLYCDFYTAGARIADWDNYVAMLLKELNFRKKEINFTLKTLYFGGGTPSLMPVHSISLLINNLLLLESNGTLEEITLEVNPEDVTIESVHAWKDIGINRISMGIQSFNNEELKAIGRLHTAEAAFKAMELLSNCFDNISIDLMFGLPGQTVESYEKSLKKVMELKPAHISSYSLMLEDRTAMTHLVNKGDILLPDETQWMEMYNLSAGLLREEGYIRYEISNYSLPGKESKHNSAYWLGNPYLGLGPGAHSYDGENIRRANPSDLKRYLSWGEQEYPVEPFYIQEKLGKIELKEETVMTRLRMTQGLSLKEFLLKFGEKEHDLLIRSVLKYINSDDLKIKDGILSFTSKGFLKSDNILADII